MPDSSEKLRDNLNDFESHHLVHSESLRNLNLKHGFAIDGFGSGLFGRLRRFLGRLLFGRYLKDQHQFNSQLVQYLNHLTTHLDVELGDRSRDEISLLSKRIARSTEDLEVLGHDVQELRAEGANSLASRLQSLENSVQINSGRIETIEAVVSGLEQILRGLADQRGYQSSEKSLVHSKGDIVVEGNSTRAEVGIKNYDYLLFENRFRGSESTVKERLGIYPAIFESSQGEVLEIGCGRGELLELLGEHKLSAFGIDLDDAMVEHCSKKGLKVAKADAVDFLSSCEPNRFSGCVAVQVIEHLEIDYFNQLLCLLSDKLQKGSSGVFETIYPCSIVALTQHYFRDPTHVAPMHPDTVSFILAGKGYQDIEVVPVNAFPREAQFQPLRKESCETPRLSRLYDQINNNFEQLNSILYGFQDYYIKARVG